MPEIAVLAGPATVGGGTHANAHVALLVDQVGWVLGTEEFQVTVGGYRTVLRWPRPSASPGNER